MEGDDDGAVRYETPRAGDDVERAEVLWYGVFEKGLRVDTSLPVLHIHTPDYWKITTDEGERVSVYFEGEFYDNVLMRRALAVIEKKPSSASSYPPRNGPSTSLSSILRGRCFDSIGASDALRRLIFSQPFQEPAQETYLLETLGVSRFETRGRGRVAHKVRSRSSEQ